MKRAQQQCRGQLQKGKIMNTTHRWLLHIPLFFLMGSVARAEPPAPSLVTAETRANAQILAQLEKPGDVLFTDDFESPESLKHYFEIRGLKEGHAQLEADASIAHRGKGCIRFTAPNRNGKSSGAGASYWFGPKGHDRIYFRRYIKFAADYHQGNLNHTGGGLSAVSGTGKWDGMGKAGIRPNGRDRFTCRFEPWCDWQREKPPGYMFLYTYWMDMKRDKDGNFWGNMLGPAATERIVPPRDQWVCLEQMIQANEPGKANGELAAWIDGKLYIHYTGIRWRSDEAVRIKRAEIGVYIHQAEKDNTVWYDDVVISTGYIGP
jgi:hypothetical protein